MCSPCVWRAMTTTLTLESWGSTQPYESTLVPFQLPGRGQAQGDSPYPENEGARFCTWSSSWRWAVQSTPSAAKSPTCLPPQAQPAVCGTLTNCPATLTAMPPSLTSVTHTRSSFHFSSELQASQLPQCEEEGETQASPNSTQLEYGLGPVSPHW